MHIHTYVMNVKFVWHCGMQKVSGCLATVGSAVT